MAKDRRKPAKAANRANELLKRRCIDGEWIEVVFNAAESPVGWLFTHGHLSLRQFQAGERLRSDWESANLAPKVTMNWDGMPGQKGCRVATNGLSPGERQLAAKQRFDAVIERLGRDMSDIAWRVICAGEALPTAEKGMGWPSRSGKLVLRMALDRIGDFYRIAA